MAVPPFMTRWPLLLALAVPLAAPAHRPRALATGGRLTPAQRDSVLYEHNRARRAVGVPPLVWSTELSAYAQDWAGFLAANSCELHHRFELQREDGRSYGENLFAQGYSGAFAGWDPSGGVRDWVGEKNLYPGGPLGKDWHSAGHYTQVVWRASRRVGCGFALCRRGDWTWRLLACNYDPPGNYLGQKPY
jgi:pathogenesis-related protein 1